jgi:hypothetical protein
VQDQDEAFRNLQAEVNQLKETNAILERKAMNDLIPGNEGGAGVGGGGGRLKLNILLNQSVMEAQDRDAGNTSVMDLLGGGSRKE